MLRISLTLYFKGITVRAMDGLRENSKILWRPLTRPEEREYHCEKWWFCWRNLTDILIENEKAFFFENF